MTAFILRDYAPSLAILGMIILGALVYMAITGQWRGR